VDPKPIRLNRLAKKKLIVHDIGVRDTYLNRARIWTDVVAEDLMERRMKTSSRREVLTRCGAAGALLWASANFGTAHAHEINAVDPTGEQIEVLRARDHGGPIVMMNLLRFKSDGGEAHYMNYAAEALPLFKKIGARIIFAARTEFCLIGDAAWEAVALVEYPSLDVFVEMATSDEYRAIHHHRVQGLEGQILYVLIQDNELFG
jgi:uncharacterized protein (DUF1330 family)